MKKNKVIFFAAVLLLLPMLFSIGCESTALHLPTRFTPIKIEDGYQYFRFQMSSTNWGNYHLENSKGEKARMKVLEMWLERSGYKNSEYEIMSRKCIFAGKPAIPIGDDRVYNIFYEIRIKCETNKAR